MLGRAIAVTHTLLQLHGAVRQRMDSIIIYAVVVAITLWRGMLAKERPHCYNDTPKEQAAHSTSKRVDDVHI